MQYIDICGDIRYTNNQEKCCIYAYFAETTTEIFTEGGNYGNIIEMGIKQSRTTDVHRCAYRRIAAVAGKTWYFAR